jgi:hypothetical protein
LDFALDGESNLIVSQEMGLLLALLSIFRYRKTKFIPVFLCLVFVVVVVEDGCCPGVKSGQEVSSLGYSGLNCTWIDVCVFFFG